MVHPHPRSFPLGAPAPRRPGAPPRRRGAIAVLVLVCLVLITALSGVLLRVGLAERDRLRGEARKLQAEWLVESGLERAAARLSEHPEYSGETWDLAASDLGGPSPGRVAIAVEAAGEDPARRLLRVRADYPSDGTARARVSKEIVIRVAAKPRSEAP